MTTIKHDNASSAPVERRVRPKATIAECLKEQMLANGEKSVWAGKPDLCISAYINSGGAVVHPLNKIKSVIDAARKSRLFKQRGYIRAMDSKGRREILHPVFVLAEDA